MVRSTVAITTLAQVVEELVQNSIDAGADTIDIQFNSSSGFLTVEDNGPGIDLANLRNCGNQHSTSKLSSVEELGTVTSFGFRGEAISSIAQLGIVAIHSRCPGSDSTYEKWMKVTRRGSGPCGC